ncbi:Nucleosome assembly protein (NAP) family protein [Leishmania donovani]|uniref:Nucleosome assembly protein (NAP) family protein n=1 Tax=Leishmania donovani TaxID=5661 RepID=A0A504WYQ1_LEIDO|nr:Nucleosome assembly protein (NAP) family protein [Leishmania donovani]
MPPKNQRNAPVVIPEEDDEGDMMEMDNMLDFQKYLDSDFSKNFMAGLPEKIRQRAQVLSAYDKDFSAQQKAYKVKEMDILRRYDALFEPLLQRRKEIVTGAAVSDEEVKKGMPEEHVNVISVEVDDTDEAATAADAFGLEGFWLRVLRHHTVIDSTIEPHDEDVLKHLVDIRSSVAEGEYGSFQVIFTFSPNDFFEEETITATVSIKDDKPELTVSPITWKPGKNVMMHTVTKKQRAKRTGQVRTTTRDVLHTCIVPNAVRYYTGEAPNGFSDFNVLVQRFKLLNLVQRVAHRDVSEMLDTVGLEGLSRQGMLTRWACSGAEGDDGDASIDPKFGRPASGFDARIAAARWNSGIEEGSSAADSIRRSRTSNRPNAAGEADAAARLTTKRRRYVVRRTHHVLHRSRSERETFFSRLAEPRQRPGALVEEVLLCDEAVPPAHSRRGDDDARWLRDAADRNASEFAEHDRRGRYGGDTYGGRHGGAFTSASPARVQRRHSLDAYAYHHQDLRAHYYAPLQPSASPPHWAAAGASDARPGEKSAGELDDYEATLPSPTDRLHSQRNVSTDGDPHAVAFTSPPLRSRPAGAAPSSLGGPARMRSMNFASLAQGDAATASPAEGQRHEDQPTAEAFVRKSPSAPAVFMADDGVVKSPFTGGDVKSFAATAPTVALPRSGGSGAAAGDAPTVPQLHLPQSRAGGGDGFVLVDAGQGSGSTSGRMVFTDSESLRAAAGNSGSTSTSQVLKSPRAVRGLAPKAKPKGAVEGARVPLEAVRHASALLSRSGSFHPSPTIGSRGGSAYNSYAAATPQLRQLHPSGARTPPTTSGFGGGVPRSPRPHTVTVQAGTAGDVGDDADYDMPKSVTPLTVFRTAASPLGSLPHSGDVAFTASPTGYQVSAATKKSFEELSSAIDHMLLDHQQLLRQVYKDTHATSCGAARQPDSSPAASRPSERAGKVPASDEASSHSSSFEVDSEGLVEETAKKARYADGVDTTIGADPVSDGATGDVDVSLHAMSAEVEDEMLLYTQLQHQLTQLDADMVRLGLENANDAAAEGSDGATGDRAGGASPLGRGAPMLQPSSSTTVTVQQPARPPHARGEVPEAIVQRLCAYRMKNFQYIAYNERLWNTSSISQFVFAQRLTAALTEECWGEVMAEVGSIMDEYVDGLVDHELQ